MSEKHYDYYVTSKEFADQKQKEYEEKIGSKRSDLIKGTCDQFGAKAYTVRNEWGGCEYICELVFSADHDICSSEFYKKRSITHDGESCFAVTGKGNRKDGVAFNKFISSVNEQLKELLNFRDWIVSDLAIMRTGFGEGTGRGTAMLSTSGGIAKGRLVFRIPNSEEDKHGKIEIPEQLEKVTYGQWYDIVNG